MQWRSSSPRRRSSGSRSPTRPGRSRVTGRGGPVGATASTVLAVALPALVLVGPSAAAAQQDGPEAAPADTLGERRSAVLRSLEAGQRVRVGLSAEGRIVGDLLQAGDDALVLEPWWRADDGRADAQGRRSLRPRAVERLWTRRSSWDRGALLGGGAGAATGALLGHELGEFACAETSGECGLEGALVGGAVLGAGGALLGAGVGALVPRWSLEFP